MAFETAKFIQDGLEIIELKNTKDNFSIQILPAFGALWHGWIVEKNGRRYNLIDHYENAADLADNLRDSHKSANLSPFACRIPDGKYTFDGKQYEFANKFKDGSAIHGLLVDKPFQQGEIIKDNEKISCSFTYPYRKDDAGYPFDYDCTVVYTLHDDKRVTLETVIRNISDATIPVVDGWHPYFTTGTKVNDCELQFSSKEIVEFDEKLIPTGNLLPYSKFEKSTLLGDTELDNAFVLDENAAQPKCTFADPLRKIKIHFYPSDHYPVLQIYTPPHRKSIAIENLSGAPDAFNNGIGLILLTPQEENLFSVTYAVEL